MAALHRFDFTLKSENFTYEKIIEKLTAWCNKWVFQLEKSENGYEHFQGRFNMFKPKRIELAQKIWQELLPSIHISPTNNACKTFNYVMKEDTRIAGPWSDDQPVKKLTTQLVDFLEKDLLPWQEKVIELTREQDFRTIHVILDNIGNNGKSLMIEYIEYMGWGYEIPPFNRFEDIMQACYDIPDQRCYLFDMPKGMKKEKLYSFFSGLECLKNGTVYDKRYAFKKRRMNRPQVIMFTNTFPDVSLMSLDRWKIHRITQNNELEDVPIPEEYFPIFRDHIREKSKNKEKKRRIE